MSRLLLLSLLLICTTFVYCLETINIGHTWMKNEHPAITAKREICREPCRKYRKKICMPKWLYPPYVNQPRCESPLTGIDPNSVCFWCITDPVLTSTPRTTKNVPKNPSIPSTTTTTTTTTTSKTTRRTKKPRTPKTASTTQAAPTQRRTTVAVPSWTNRTTLEKCRNICGNYSGICLPEWLDEDDWLHPHCEGVGDVRKPKSPCLFCLYFNGIPDWLRGDIDGICTPECFCHREVVIKQEVRSKNCSSFGFCGGTDSTVEAPKRIVRDVSYCDCAPPKECSDRYFQRVNKFDAGASSDEGTKELSN